MSLNKVMLIGNVGNDPEVRYVDGPSGQAKVAQFSVATTERFRSRSGENRDITEWHNIVVWRGLADVAEKYVKKGTQLYVEGRIRTRSWEDQTGNKRYTTEVIGDKIELLGRRSDNPATSEQNSSSTQEKTYTQNENPFNQKSQSQPATQQPAEPDFDINVEDDLPF